MRPAAITVVLRIVAAAGIPGIIAGSIAENDAVAMTFGALTGVAAFGLIVVTAATAEPSAPADVDEVGASLEARVARLVDAGADEDEVRALVGDAVRLARHQQRS